MNFINFNNAGSSKTFSRTNSKIKEYLDQEERLGGYYCVEVFKLNLLKFYQNLSNLINCQPEEISFISNTTVGFNLFINSIKVAKGDNFVILENEYESNLISLLNNKIDFRVVKLSKGGEIDFDDLNSKIDSKTKVVSVCHIPSNNGNQNPIKKIGKLVKDKNPKTLYLVDACQSIGHLDVNVKLVKCDALVGSGRKYLRGPRGTGFIFIREKIQGFINPLMLDIHNSSLERKIKVTNNHIFENFEYSPALKIGLSEAINQINKVGIESIEKDIIKKTIYFREKLKKIPKVTIYENNINLTGINTLNVEGRDPKHIFNLLLKKKILTSVTHKKQLFKSLGQKKKNLSALRVSIHYYNTYKQIDYLIECFSELKL